MKVEARSLLIENVLKKGQFIIPDYQREYDWTTENLDEFFEDINTIEDESYFIGHMVCEGEFNGDKFKVIDGQQRITTITIMLSVLRDIFYVKELSNLSRGLNDNYIFSRDKNNEKFVILDNKMPYPVLQAYVQSEINEKDKSIVAEKSGEKKIIKAYEKFYSEWKDLDEKTLKILRDKILNLEIIFVAVDDEVDAFTIFETLNAKGKDLTPLDLIKNCVFKNYNKQTHINEPHDSWVKIIRNTKDKNINFLNTYWASKYKKVSDRKLYKEFIRETTNKDYDYNVFVSDLLDNSIMFNQLLSPSPEYWKGDNEFRIFFSLSAIQTFKIKVANSLLLSLIREYKNKNISLKYMRIAVQYIEKFHFINNAIIGGRSSGLDTMYSKISRDLYNANNKHKKHGVIINLIKKLKERLPKQELFYSNFNERVYYNSNKTKQKKLVQYILHKLEYEKQKYNVQLMSTSIEHIYPEKFNSNWDKIDDEDIGKIGNLTLLDKDLNSKVGNKDYDTKKNIILKDSTLIITKEIFNKYEKWTIKEINQRTNDIIKELYEL